MPYFEFLWTDGIGDHLAEHGVSVEEFEAIVSDPHRVGVSRSSGNLYAIGESADARILFCVYRMIDDVLIDPVTACEIGDDA